MNEERGVGKVTLLIEKWVIVQKLGDKAWFDESEKYYYQEHQNYYNNIRVLGLEYAEPDYSKVLPFLLMLPKGIVIRKGGGGYQKNVCVRLI